MTALSSLRKQGVTGLLLAALILVGFLAVRPFISGDRRPDEPAPFVAPRDEPSVVLAAAAEESDDQPSEAPARAAAATSRTFRFFLNDQPAADTEFALLPWDDEIALAARSHIGLPKSLIARLAQRFVTGASGEASVDVPFVPFFLAARAPGSAPFGQRFDRLPEDVSLSLPPEQHLRGIVVNNIDEPVSGVTVLAHRAFQDEYVYDRVRDDDQRTAGMFFESTVPALAGGSFDVGGLPAARVFVIALAGHKTSERRVDFVLPSEEVCELMLRDALTWRGLVADEATGQPLEGARVSSFERNGDLSIFQHVVTTTDALGRFELAGVPAAADLFGLRVSRREYATYMRRLEPSVVERNEDLFVPLKRACSVAGVVRSRQGEPLAGVWVQVHQDGTFDLVDYTQTDAAGRFAIEFVAPGERYALVGSGKGYYIAIQEGVEICSVSEHEILLDPLPSLRGRVLVDDYPLQQGVARVFQEDPAGNRLVDAVADVAPATGDFEFAFLDAGRYVLDVSASGHAPVRVANVPVQNEADVNTIEVTLQRGASLRGAVFVKGTRQAIIGAKVTLGDEVQDGRVLGPLPEASTAVTDGNGDYLLENVPVGTARKLFVDHPDYSVGTAVLFLEEGSLSARLDVELTRACLVTATVTDELGRRFMSIDGTAYTSEGERRSTWDSSGVLRFDRLPPGSTTIQVGVLSGTRADLRDRRMNQRFELAEGETRSLTFSLAGGARIHGRLIGPASSPLFRRLWVVSALLERPDLFDHTSSPDHHGYYVLSGIAPGRRVVFVEPADAGTGFRVSRTVDLLPGSDIELDFPLPLSGMQGTVAARGGGPVVGALIQMLPRDPAASAAAETPYPLRLETRSNESGAYEIVGAQPGSYAFSVKAAGFACEEGMIQIADEEAVVQQNIVLEKEARLEVVLSDRAGSPVLSTACTVERADGASLQPLRALPELLPDRLVFEGAATALYRARVRAEGFFPAEQTASCTSGTTTTLPITLRRPGSLVIRLVSPAALPAAQVALDVLDLQTGARAADWIAAGLVTSSTSSSATDLDGEIRLDGLPEGRFRISAPGASKEIDVLPGAVTGPVTLQQAP
ncbi:MAG: carboxypeptidase regulatory-like domain-containing protein [Planctomycetes bacterium]|nr:carboxypeptidase regulatory-like domain-containing protein [Planctomycetota bacterium]